VIVGFSHGNYDRPKVQRRPRKTVTAGADGVVLAAQNVARRYGSHVALQPTSLDVHAGETLALVGPNGAGKSTLLSILAGALEPSEGEVTSSLPRARIGWAPQRPAQYGRLSARENLLLFARLEGLDDPAAAVERVLARISVDSPDRPAGELSTGEQQRVNIGVALLTEPEVLLLDEPTASLDPAQRERVWELVESVTAHGGAAVLATQHPEEVARLADSVAALENGAVVFRGSYEDYAAR
jgi:ABC-type multidrug transport system ATPase subunit